VTGSEERRLQEDDHRVAMWKRWGPYLSERQWGTVREDYSAKGDSWEYFPHDQARSRAYRWGEDGLLGISDRKGRLCLAVALWNGRDPILKERLFGLTGPEGNHGEDVKESYFYLDATPTSSYLRALYQYPQREFPYGWLVEENRRRSREQPEFNLLDTGIFDDDRYFDVQLEYAKGDPEDLLMRITVDNRAAAEASVHVLPTVWFRNTWSWGRTGEHYPARPSIRALDDLRVALEHDTLGAYVLEVSPTEGHAPPTWLFTNNETNVARLYGGTNPVPYVKDAFHEYVVHGRRDAVSPAGVGTKAAAHYALTIPARGRATVDVRLRRRTEDRSPPFTADFGATLALRLEEASAFYASRIPATLTEGEACVARQAYAGLLWSRKFYHYAVDHWLEGDPAHPPPPNERRRGRNADWRHIHNADIISVPDSWEYPWYAAWDLAFHTLPLAKVDPTYAKEQLLLFLREWYMHPNGQLPAYEFALDDVNPPVHAWAVWRVYKLSGARGARDLRFLERAFHKLLLNFTWWVNRKDPDGRNLFAGGFLGLDNIGVFDRSRPLPTGGTLEQADGTAWMAFYCATMLSISLELARHLPVYDDVAAKFFEHFIAIVDAMNTMGGTGLWHEEDGFYYDQLRRDGEYTPLRVRSMVGLVPLFACEIIEDDAIAMLPSFSKRMRRVLKHRPDLARHVGVAERRRDDGSAQQHRLLAIPSRERLVRVLRYLLDESEFLSPFGVRSVSKAHERTPYRFHVGSDEFRVAYDPGEGTTGMFGGNSNWRGPIWFPVNYLLIEALERYGYFYGDSLRVECPVGSGRMLTLEQVAYVLSERLTRLFLPDASGQRPAHGDDRRFAADGPWRDLILFHEYFHGDDGRGLGASHQTGWTALVTRCLESIATARCPAPAPAGAELESLAYTQMFKSVAPP